MEIKYTGIQQSENQYSLTSPNGKTFQYRPEIPNYRDKNYFYQKIDTYLISLSAIRRNLNSKHTKQYFEKRIPIYNQKLDMIEQRTKYMMNINGYWIPKALLQSVLDKIPSVRQEVRKKKEELNIV